MAFSTPATSTAGTVLTASFLNTYVRDNVAWIATDSPACRAYNSANVSIATGTPTVITLNSERYDNSGMHSTSSNTSRITVPSGGDGKYVVGGAIEFATSSAGNYRGNYVKLNGSTFVVAQQQNPIGNTFTPGVTVMTVYALSAADYVEMFGAQDSGGALNAQVTANYSPEFYAFWFRT